jgi:hypothetical protein
MESGRWDDAASAFANAMRAAFAQGRPTSQDAQVNLAADRSCMISEYHVVDQLQAVCTTCKPCTLPGNAHDLKQYISMQYLAGVRLIGASTKQSRVKGAQLTRYAAALSGLEDRHRLALVQSAASRNMEVGNYG